MEDDKQKAKSKNENKNKSKKEIKSDKNYSFATASWSFWHFPSFYGQNCIQTEKISYYSIFADFSKNTVLSFI